MAATSRAGPRRGLAAGDSGMVTVEAAVSLCAFVTVLAMALNGMSVVVDQLRCIDAAGEAARLVARGEQDRVPDVVRRIAPGGATVAVRMTDDDIVVSVRDPVAGGLLPGVRAAADAYAVAEPGVESGAGSGAGSGATSDDSATETVTPTSGR